MKADWLNWFEFKYELISKKNLIYVHGNKAASIIHNAQIWLPPFIKQTGDAKKGTWNKTRLFMFQKFT
jgi:hypothetical protein